jgi:hypothetical protein
VVATGATYAVGTGATAAGGGCTTTGRGGGGGAISWTVGAFASALARPSTAGPLG